MLCVCRAGSLLHKVVACTVQGQRAPFFPSKKKIFELSKISTLKFAVSSWFTMNLAGLEMDLIGLSWGQKPHSAVLHSRLGSVAWNRQEEEHSQGGH